MVRRLATLVAGLALGVAAGVVVAGASCSAGTDELTAGCYGHGKTQGGREACDANITIFCEHYVACCNTGALNCNTDGGPPAPDGGMFTIDDCKKFAAQLGIACDVPPFSNRSTCTAETKACSQSMISLSCTQLMPDGPLTGTACKTFWSAFLAP